jgi:Glycosyl transferase family 11
LITIRLMGGLGNQLFGWALGVAFEARNQQVRYDTSLLEADPARRYLLGDLGLSLNLTTAGFPPTFVEGSLRYDPKILDMKGDHVLQGYWQSEKYFEHEAGRIRRILFAKTKFSPETMQVAMKIMRHIPNTCFVHVRRTDNLRPTSTIYHGLTSGGAYYEQAIPIIEQRFLGVRLFVFSDDPQWPLRYWKMRTNMTVVSHNATSFTEDETHNLHKNDTGREVEDLWLMSLCRHAILSNSTFAWWGAWLRDRDERIVIAPDPWFSGQHNLDSTDILPDRWLKVSTQFSEAANKINGMM